MVSSGLSAAEIEIQIGHKLPDGVGRDECGQQRSCEAAQVARKAETIQLEK